MGSHQSSASERHASSIGKNALQPGTGPQSGCIKPSGERRETPSQFLEQIVRPYVFRGKDRQPHQQEQNALEEWQQKACHADGNETPTGSNDKEAFEPSFHRCTKRARWRLLKSAHKCHSGAAFFVGSMDLFCFQLLVKRQFPRGIYPGPFHFVQACSPVEGERARNDGLRTVFQQSLRLLPFSCFPFFPQPPSRSLQPA